LTSEKGRKQVSYQLRKRIAAAVLTACFPSILAAQKLDDARSGGEAGGMAWPWQQRAQNPHPTIILPKSAQVWADDNRRETGRERDFWWDYRKRLKRRLLDREQTRTAAILGAIRARTAILEGGSDGKAATVESPVPGKSLTFPRPENWPPGREVLANMTTVAKRHLDAATSTVHDAARSLAGSVDNMLPGTQGSSSGSVGVIIALLVIFLAPAVLLTALTLAVLKLRKRRR